MRKKTRRTEQVSSLIMKNLSEIILSELSDPAMGIVSVTDVEVTVDLRVARVYFTVMGGGRALEKQINTVKGMGKFLRVKLASRVQLKYMPEIKLFYDETPRKAQRIETIIAKLKREGSLEQSGNE